ncbi:MAG: glycosyltransferase family 2 protein [Sphingomonadaceae bacterium]
MEPIPAASAIANASVRVGVVVASLGRAEILGHLLDDLHNQSLVPDRIVLSVTTREDLPPRLADYPRVEVIVGPKGSCVQRNTGLDHLGDSCDLIVFCDDDYVPSRFAIERIVKLFEANPDIAGATGHLLADGVNSPGISVPEARDMLRRYDREAAPPAAPYRDLGGLYGCNMAFRSSAIGDVRFDERLRLYGWQEDIDFSVRVRPRGRIVKSFAFAGVHCGVKAGRSPGLRIGYSQVVNPVYLVRKGTMDWRYAINIVVRNVSANHYRALRAEPWVDRIGRVRGNWLGIVDVLFGKITPERVEKL